MSEYNQHFSFCCLFSSYSHNLIRSLQCSNNVKRSLNSKFRWWNLNCRWPIWPICHKVIKCYAGTMPMIIEFLIYDLLIRDPSCWVCFKLGKYGLACYIIRFRWLHLLSSFFIWNCVEWCFRLPKTESGRAKDWQHPLPYYHRLYK